VLALVGNSGNSLAPHLHFHVMNGPLSLASNGLPYEVDSWVMPIAAGVILLLAFVVQSVLGLQNAQ
jgi:murein DD-endopeptidase MepM/ murein hydrolase activator NlpD